MENFEKRKKDSQLSLRSDEECEEYYKSMQSLMTEKERLNQEQQKIRENKFLKMVDRNNAIKSVRSLSKTIDDLINKEKEKISEHYNSKLSKSRCSIDNEESILLKSKQAHQTQPNKKSVSPGGTTDSLQFSQSIALSNLAATIRNKKQEKGQIQFDDLKNNNSVESQCQEDSLVKSQLIFSGI